MTADLDTHVNESRHRSPADAGPFTFVAAEALTTKVREDGRVINTVVLVAIGVNGDGQREVLGLQVASSETGRPGTRSSLISQPGVFPGCG